MNRASETCGTPSSILNLYNKSFRRRKKRERGINFRRRKEREGDIFEEIIAKKNFPDFGGKKITHPRNSMNSKNKLQDDHT